MIITIRIFCSLELLNFSFTKMGLCSQPWQLELKLGLGGTSYEDFIRNMHLPLQLRFLLNFYLSIVHRVKIQSKHKFVMLNCKVA